MTGHMAGNDGDLTLDPERRPPHPAVLQHLQQHLQRRVAGNREADPLGARNDGGVDAHHLACRIDQRPTGIARIERRIGLDHVVDETACLRPERPTALTTPAVTLD